MKKAQIDLERFMAQKEHAKVENIGADWAQALIERMLKRNEKTWVS